MYMKTNLPVNDLVYNCHNLTISNSFINSLICNKYTSPSGQTIYTIVIGVKIEEHRMLGNHSLLKEGKFIETL
jgi:hypothetical protein